MNLKDEENFGLLTKAVMENMDLAQYVLLRVPIEYNSLKRTILDYFCCQETFSQANIGNGREEDKENYAIRILGHHEITVD